MRQKEKRFSFFVKEIESNQKIYYIQEKFVLGTASLLRHTKVD